MTRCILLVLGHLPSADNTDGLRSRDQPALDEAVEAFRAQTSAAGPLLAAWAQLVSAVYSPSTRRHAESAQLLCDVTGLSSPVVDARLDNVDYGRFKGRPLAETPPAVRHVSRPYPQGSSWAEVLQRWRSFSETTLRRHGGDVVLLAGQSGAAARMLESICVGRPLHEVLDDRTLDVPFLNSAASARAVWTYTW